MFRFTFLILLFLSAFDSGGANKDADIVYRVIIYEGTREGAEDAQAAFEEKHPEVKVYFTFQTPRFVIEAGDFSSKGKAKKFQKSIIEEYPRSIIVKRKSKLIMLDG